MSDITGFKDMNPKRYQLHHDHGTVTISSDVFETMSKELERLRPMETGLELAEADRDAYRNRVDEQEKEIERLNNLVIIMRDELSKHGVFSITKTIWQLQKDRDELRTSIQG